MNPLPELSETVKGYMHLLHSQSMQPDKIAAMFCVPLGILTFLEDINISASQGKPENIRRRMKSHGIITKGR